MKKIPRRPLLVPITHLKLSIRLRDFRQIPHDAQRMQHAARSELSSCFYLNVIFFKFHFIY